MEGGCDPGLVDVNRTRLGFAAAAGMSGLLIVAASVWVLATMTNRYAAARDRGWVPILDERSMPNLYLSPWIVLAAAAVSLGAAGAFIATRMSRVALVLVAGLGVFAGAIGVLIGLGQWPAAVFGWWYMPFVSIIGFGYVCGLIGLAIEDWRTRLQ